MYQFEREPSRLPLEPNEIPPFDFDPYPYPDPPKLLQCDPNRIDYVKARIGEFPPEQAGWVLVEPVVKALFSEWRFTGYSNIVLRLWIRAFCRWAASVVIGKRKHLNREVQENFVLQHPEMLKVLAEAEVIHGRRVAALEHGSEFVGLTSIDLPIVETWKQLTISRDRLTSVTEPPAMEYPIEQSPVPTGETRKSLLDRTLRAWEAQTGISWSAKDVAALAGCDDSTLRHWKAGRDAKAGSRICNQMKRVLKLTGSEALQQLKPGQHQAA